MIKRRIMSVIVSLSLLCGIFSISVTNVQASDLKKVDGSYLTKMNIQKDIRQIV